ncbi:MAG: PAS domain-containing protein [Rhodobiaceae bacterium]|nr:PAS domain-containing protein [Rhodobiaceae bacterium]
MKSGEKNKLTLAEFRLALNATANSPLCRRAALAIFVCMLAINVVLLVPLYLNFKQEHNANIVTQARNYLSSVVDVGRLPSIDVMVTRGEALSRSSDLVGGMFLNSAGDVKGVFGQRPTLKWIDIAASANPDAVQVITDGRYHEFYLSPARSGINMGAIIRYDGSNLWRLVQVRLVTFVILGLLGTIAITVVTMVIVAAMVMYPIQRMRDTIEFALNQPAKARKNLSRFDARDEVGAMSRALDRLLTLLSEAHGGNVLTPSAVLEHIPNPVITFDEHDQVTNANRAALDIFGAELVADLNSLDWSQQVLIAGEPVSLEDLMSDGQFQGAGELITPSGTIACLIGGNRMAAEDDGPKGRCLIFTVADELLEDMRREHRLRVDLERRAGSLKRRNESLRQMLEACITLITGGGEPASLISTNPERCISGWLENGGAGNSVVTAVDYTSLPPILSDPQDARRIFEWALTTLSLRSRASETRLALEVKVVGEDRAEFTFREPEDLKQDTGEAALIDADADVTVLLGAVGRLVARQKGRMIDAGGEREGNRIVFQLPIDVAGMVIKKGEKERKATKKAA